MKKKPAKKSTPKRITLRDVQAMPPEEQAKHNAQHLPGFNEIKALFDRQRAQQRDLRAKLAGDGDGSLERAFLEMVQLTGLDFDRLAEMPVREFYAIVQASLRKQESANWVPVSYEDLRHDKAGLSRYAKDPNSGLRRKGRGEFLVRRDRLAFFVRPTVLEKYQG